MTHWTEQELEEYMSKRFGRHTRKELADTFSGDADDGPESKLQSKIEKWAREYARPCLSFRQSTKARGFLQPGWPDVILIMPKGKVVFIELKSSRGRLSDEQKGIALQFLALGHTVHEVRSFRQFLALMQDDQANESI